MGKGATGIRKEVAEKERSTPLPWRHATTLATRGETKTSENRDDKTETDTFRSENDASEERMTQMSIAEGWRGGKAIAPRNCESYMWCERKSTLEDPLLRLPPACLFLSTPASRHGASLQPWWNRSRGSRRQRAPSPWI